ncbi:hypothetical protein CK203_050828 [Vitis vinifera]|uniref:Uncharacterized protein n=1 Tax=Vitis vinifera TaxID=29760 RepID=A0A438HBK5_VITVI|nr:hypothetical protein CK203_050828 [Vitis vinifera]
MCGGDDHLAWKHPVSFGGVQRVAYRRGGGYQIEYIWAIFLHTYQLIHTESLSYRTLSSVSIFVGEFIVTDLDSPLWIRVGGRLTRVSDQLDQRSDQGDMDSQIVTLTSLLRPWLRSRRL